MIHSNKVYLLLLCFSLFYLSSKSQNNLTRDTSLLKPLYLNLSVLPANYAYNKLGFFCKKEILLEKITKIPFRFRLGSVAECNYLEGK